MDFVVLNRGEKIAGIAGVVLILVMFIFDWYSVKVAGVAVPDSGVNAWDAYDFISWVLLITALSAIGLALLAASDYDPGLPVAGSAIVCALGILSTLLIIFRIIDKPGGDVGLIPAFGGPEVSVSLSIGVFLGLISAAAIAVGGYLGMQEEGTSFAGEADRFRGGGPGGPGAGPPPPPPPSQPPSAPPPPTAQPQAPPPPPPSSTPPPQGGQ
jgi:hypothetical protein